MKKTQTYGLTHLAIAVRDVNRTLKFYQEIFDLAIMYREKNMIQLATPGCNDIIVFEEKEMNMVGKPGGIDHFGFRLREAKDIQPFIKKF